MRKHLDIPLTLAVTLALTFAMLWPLDQPPPAPEGSDKLLPVFIGASTFGGAIELIQPSFNRSADINDWIADAVGVILGIGLGLLYRRLRRH